MCAICEPNASSWEIKITSASEHISMFLEYQRVLDHDKVMVKCPMSVVEKFLKEEISNLPQHPSVRQLYPCGIGPDNYVMPWLF